MSQVVHLGDTPHLDKLIGAVKTQLDLYSEGKLSAVYIAYTRFVNTMKQEAVIEQLLPLSSEHFEADDGTPATSWTTSTSRTRRQSSTNCSCVTSRRWCTSTVAENMARSNRRAWSR